MLKRKKLFLPFLFALTFGTFALGGSLKFLKSRLSRRYDSVPRKVLTFYYSWYGRPERHGRWVHWAKVEPENHRIATSVSYTHLTLPTKA